MKFNWHYRYVPEGQLEPDDDNRWAIDCHIMVNIEKGAPQYQWYRENTGQEYIQVPLASIVKKGTKGAIVPSLIHEYCACIPSLEDAANTGLTNERYFYSNDIEDLKRKVEEQILKIRDALMYCE